ncbi:P-loop containing nucleoside triphosphate hydrolase protein [Immersiella caudata]|uniref:P-loop containing nucleoside triphosphate hydrolase protein n=1 Tax=Immersiella caudata TaxID=314043 RepID=A0AA39X6Q6_9PEZI|nr:P-loop containing nucleoside triphosphate hydrolase protein [Immersiella caudata]
MRVAHLEAIVQGLVAAYGGANKNTPFLPLSLKGVGDAGSDAGNQVNSTIMELGAFSIRNVSDPTGKRGTTTCELEIRDKPLIRVLKIATNKYPGVNFDGDVLFLQSPFAVLVYHPPPPPPPCLPSNLVFLFSPNGSTVTIYTSEHANTSVFGVCQIHNWDRLMAAATTGGEPSTPPSDSEEDEGKRETCRHLKDLLAAVQSTPELSYIFKAWETASAQKNSNSKRTKRTITFDTLWTIFPPLGLVVARPFLHVPQILQVDDLSMPCLPVPGQKWFRVWVRGWDWNGKMMSKVHYELKMPRFQGVVHAGDLPFYPLADHDQPDALRTTIRARSMRFIRATAYCASGAAQAFLHEGPAYAHGPGRAETSQSESEASNFLPSFANDEGAAAPRILQINGEFVCDALSFSQHATAYPPLGGTWRRNEIRTGELEDVSEDAIAFEDAISMLDIESDSTPDETDFLLLPPRFLGYATRERIWAQFNIETTSPAPGRRVDKFQDHLQLDRKYKRMIEALLFPQSQKLTTHMRDIVHTKGRGTALLFHGPPGVGKTVGSTEPQMCGKQSILTLVQVTAETVAEALGKPLLVIGVAEIGLNPAVAERNLEKYYNLAAKWDAILLIDEADIFLEARTSASDIGRNALLTVMLRVLEYFTGVVILTTNRIKAVDIAVLSRIHLAIRYEDLTVDQMRNIFKYFLDMFEPESIHNRESINDFIESFGYHYNLNGRQIRNTVRSALALASHDDASDSRLTWKHLKTVCEITRDFQEQVKDNVAQQRYNNEVMRDIIRDETAAV